MSLAAFLLKSSGKNKTIDAELNAVFRSQTTEQPTQRKKEKRRSESSNVRVDEPPNKRVKPLLAEGVMSSASPGKQKKGGKSHVKGTPEPVPEPPSSGEGGSEGSKNVSANEFDLENSDTDGDGPSTLTHETLQKDKPTKSASKKVKYTPPDETKERRDARTVFIGNLAPEVAVKRPLQKQLRRHILAFLPTAKIESTRFRSVAFQTPTSKLPGASDEGKKSKQPRQHDKERASSWRDAHKTDDPKTDEKKFLTPNQKKKIAFINKNIHSDADSVHAYIVFAYPAPHSRPSNLPLLPPVMDPFEAAHLAIEKCDCTWFLDRMLRVDAVSKGAQSESDGTIMRTSALGDPKLTIFVGNLDFASKEEDLRVYFEGVVSAERGPPDAETSPDEGKPKCWVTRVRMIRDQDTQLGKGFAYVQFLDRTCVDEILALEPGKLKFAKRKLRVQRCRSMPSGSSAKTAPPSKPVQTSSHAAPSPVPRGDPSLGEKLAQLTKEERKRIKAEDADRLARRLAKKKARMALVRQGVPPQGKQRERVRKTGAAKKLGGAPPKKSKGRVRSEKSFAKRNTKK